MTIGAHVKSETVWHLAVFYTISKLYANCVLANLNSRQSLREDDHATFLSSFRVNTNNPGLITSKQPHVVETMKTMETDIEKESALNSNHILRNDVSSTVALCDTDSEWPLGKFEVRGSYGRQGSISARSEVIMHQALSKFTSTTSHHYLTVWSSIYLFPRGSMRLKIWVRIAEKHMDGVLRDDATRGRAVATVMPRLPAHAPFESDREWEFQAVSSSQLLEKNLKCGHTQLVPNTLFSSVVGGYEQTSSTSTHYGRRQNAIDNQDQKLSREILETY
ncbi:hypothetical protein BJ138DRAFT_1101149 [Hygrophoropsis aurantiaca]|uniref:Uncharacterized protein n=1 Tax=Hygrophoropsis aurantiaca TaxID=72124 RepID=A0ACB8ADL4_9AGAM|nr:hypothetical protein BJ138DRAFT_1101149 [Hygrophoropsis aurantiaca]